MTLKEHQYKLSLKIEVKNKIEEKFYTPEELEMQLSMIKKFLDRTYLDIKLSRYGKEQADRAMLAFFLNGDIGCFPGEERRKQFEAFTYHGDEIYQVLLDFALSAYIADRKKGIPSSTNSLDEVHMYTGTDNETLEYSQKKVIEVAALATTENTYWATNLLACNKKLKQELVKAFVQERYSNFERRKELDNTSKSFLVKLNSGKELMMSKTRLNRDIDNMIRDEYYNEGHFDPENIITNLNTRKM